MPTTSSRKVVWTKGTYSHQTEVAWKLMDRYIAYARSIGVELVGDTILCEEKQEAKLAKWWKENVTP